MHASLLTLLKTTAVAVLVAALTPTLAAAQSSAKTIKAIPGNDLRVLDPIWTTTYTTRNHGYMIYDTLFAVDKDYQPQPQMVDSWTVSDDKLTYTFKLREGLRFHDGQPVRPADCIASIARWGKRDVLGQALMERVASMDTVDDKSFVIKLKRPFSLILDALAKPSSNVPFIMPERVAKTDAFTQIQEAIGSGPFKFVREEWQPGNKVVYVKNPDYVPRKEPPSWASGGKVVKVDRVEWLYIPDATTAAAALAAGEVDWWETVPHDLVPVLERNRDIVVGVQDPLGAIGTLRFNHLHPPFDNPKMRQALLAAMELKDFLQAIAGAPKNWKECPSFFTCGTPMSNTAGSEALTGPRSLDRARQLIKEAGYNNERIVLLSPTDVPAAHAQGLVMTELMRKLGLNVELQANDFGTLTARRASKEPVDKGGWSIFATWWVGTDLADPAVNAALRGHGQGAWFGWPTDPRMEEMRTAWLEAPDLDTRKAIAADIQRRAFDTVPYLPIGQFVLPTAHRKNIEGLILSPVILFWNVEKK